MSEEKETTEEKSEEVEVAEDTEKESEAKDDFETESETVPVGKYNQAVRKQREMEAEKRELEKRLEVNPEVKPEDKEDFFEEKEDPSKLIDEKLKPVFDTLKKREENEKKNARTLFFDAHPEYLKDSEKWQGLLDEMDNSLNPNSTDDHYTQLEKTHRIISGDSFNAQVEDKKSEMASDSSGGVAEKAVVNEEFTAEERKIMKEMNISEDGMKSYRQKLKDGSMVIM
jgi:hypothetical protein